MLNIKSSFGVWLTVPTEEASHIDVVLNASCKWVTLGKENRRQAISHLLAHCSAWRSKDKALSLLNSFTLHSPYSMVKRSLSNFVCTGLHDLETWFHFILVITVLQIGCSWHFHSWSLGIRHSYLVLSYVIP